MSEESLPKNLCPEASSALKQVLGTRRDGAVHPVTRLAFADTFKLQSLYAKSPAN